MSEAQASEAIAPKDMVLDADAKIDVEVISLMGGAFSIDDKALDEDTIELNVMAAVPTRSWFKEAFKPGVKAFPTCFSVGALVPSKNSPEVQSTDCESCPKSKWGGKEQPECQERRKLVGLRVVDGEGGREINPRLSILTVPPTSVTGTKKFPGGWQKYLGQLGITTGLSARDVVTKIKIKPNAPSMGFRLIFENGGTVLSQVQVNPAVLVAFRQWAVAEARREAVPPSDKPEGAENVDVVAEAQKKTQAGREEARKTPTGSGEKF